MISKRTVIFSRRDKLDCDKEYYGKIYNKINRSTWTIFVISLLLYIGFIALSFHSIPDFTNKDNLRYFFSTSSQTIGAIFGIVITLVFILIQINIQKYGHKIYSYLLQNKIILIYPIIALSSIIFSLISLLFVEKSILFEIFVNKQNITFLTDYLFKFSFVLVMLSLFFMPFFIYELISKLNTFSYLRYLYDKLSRAIQNNAIDDVEDTLLLLINVINTGVRDRNRDTIKEGIETLHDLIKLAIRNETLINNLMLHTNKPEGMFNYRSNWFESEIFDGFESSYDLLLETKQYNSACYLLRALNSCAIETLNSQHHDPIRSEIVTVYEKLIISSLRDNAFKKESIQEFKHFLERTLCINESDFRILINDIFEKKFIIQLIKKSPESLNVLISIYFHYANKKSHLCNVTDDNLVNLIRQIRSIISTYKKLLELKEINSKLILFFNKRIFEEISDMAYLLSLFVFMNGNKKHAYACKKEVNKFLRLKTMSKKVKKIITDKNDWNPRFNYLAHYLFTEIEDSNGNPKHIFSHKKLIKLSEDFSKSNGK